MTTKKLIELVGKKAELKKAATAAEKALTQATKVYDKASAAYAEVQDVELYDGIPVAVEVGDAGTEIYNPIKDGRTAFVTEETVEAYDAMGDMVTLTFDETASAALTAAKRFVATGEVTPKVRGRKPKATAA